MATTAQKNTTDARTTDATDAAPKTTAETVAQTPTEARLHEREPITLVRQGGMALAGVARDAVELLRVLPERASAVKQTPELLRELPGSVRELPDALRGQGAAAQSRIRAVADRTAREVDAQLRRAEARFDAKAAEGSEVVADVRRDPRVHRVETEARKVWEQGENTRRQVKAAWTSVRKTADVAVDAGREQFGNARTHLKAATTSARKASDVAVEAGRGQAVNARRQVKAAVTSARKTATTAGEAARTLSD